MNQQASHFVAMIHLLWTLLSPKTTYTLRALLCRAFDCNGLLSVESVPDYAEMLSHLSTAKKIFNFEPSIKTNPAAGVVPTVHILDVYLM